MINDVGLPQRVDVSRRIGASRTNRKDSASAPFPVIVCVQNLRELGRRVAAVRILQEADLAGWIPGIENGSKAIDFSKDRPAGALGHTGMGCPDRQIQRRSKDAFILELEAMFLSGERRAKHG